MHVEVYRNLHNGKLSIRNRKTKRVIAHAKSVQLAGAVFKVSQAGRERVLRERRKNVHAVVVGKLLGFSGEQDYKDNILGEYLWEWSDGVDRFPLFGDEIAVYNPYKYASFVVPSRDYAPIRVAEACNIDVDIGIQLGVLHRLDDIGLGNS